MDTRREQSFSPTEPGIEVSSVSSALAWAARATIIGLAALSLSACVTMQVASRLEPGTDINRYHVFEWAPDEELPTGDPRLDNNPFFHDYLKAVVDRQLLRRGFVATSTAAMPAELLIHYHANVNQRIDINQVDREHGYCYRDCEPGVIDYQQGTLVIDIVDAATKKIVWRGWAQDSMEGIVERQDRMEREIEEAVTRMLADFPARSLMPVG